MYPTPTQLRPVAEVTQQMLVGLAQDDQTFKGVKLIPGTEALGNKATGTYFKVNVLGGVAHDLKWAEGKHAPLAVGKPLTTGTYVTSLYAQRARILDRSRRDAIMPADPEAIMLMELIEALKVQREKDFANLFVAGNCGAGTNTSLGATGYRDSSSNPFRDIKVGVYDMRAATGRKPNKLVMGSSMWEALVDNDALVSRMSNYGSQHGITLERFSALMGDHFGIEEVEVVDGLKNTAGDGLAQSLSDIMGDDLFLFHHGGSVVTEDGPVLRATFAERIKAWDWTADTYRDEGEKADYLRIYYDEALEVVDTNLCYGIFGGNP